MGIDRSAVLAVAAAASLSLPSTVLSQGRVGPSFDCSSAAARTQPLPQIVCASDELARLELGYVIAYQALRHRLNDQDRGDLFREAQATTERMARACNLPTAAAGTRPDTRTGTRQEIACLSQLYRDFTAQLQGRSDNQVLAEAKMPPEQLMQIQATLKAGGLLPAEATVDGVFGPQTRGAIMSWQRQSGVRADGFGSPELLASIQAAAGAAPQSASPQFALPQTPPHQAVVPPAIGQAPQPVPRPAAGASHPVLPLETALPPLDLRVCPTREATLMQAREAGRSPAARPPCEQRPLSVELLKPEPGIEPYRALIAHPAPGSSSAFGFIHGGAVHSLAYEWRLAEVRVWQVRVHDRGGKTEYAEVPERPIEIAFLRERGAWPPAAGERPNLQVCPAGPSAWFEDRRSSCKVWNQCPQRGETVEWTGRCHDGFAEGPGTIVWRFAGTEQRHETELSAGKPLERPEWLTDANSCRIGNWLGATVRTFISWTGPCGGGLAEGDGKLQWSGAGTTGGIYAGRLSAGRPEGYGILTYVTGAGYEGHWERGKRHGYGKYTYLSGDRYDGEWRENTRHGRGALAYKNGARYDGEWSGDRASGRGTMVYTDGNRYEGDWRDGKRHGRGALTWPNGNRYDGEWREDKRTGLAVFTWQNGARYEGDWLDGKRNGRGVFVQADGGRYEGEWRDDRVSGRGTMRYANGNRYEGQWRDGEQHGHGVFTWENSDRYDGEFRDGKRTGTGIYIWKDGTRFEGEFRDGKRHGRGVQTWDRGRYEGNWRDDNRNGNGVQVHTFTGGRYEGEWRDNKPNGYGSATIQGTLYTGTWANGCFQQGSRQASFTLDLSDCGFR